MERCRFHQLPVVTGTDLRVGPVTGSAAAPGSHIALYLAAEHLPEIRDPLQSAGIAGDGRVQIDVACRNGDAAPAQDDACPGPTAKRPGSPPLWCR